MLRPVACEVLGRLKMATLDPATGDDSRASSSKFTNDKGKVLMISQIHLESKEGRLKQGHTDWLGRFSPLNTLERSHLERTDLLEAHSSLDD